MLKKMFWKFFWILFHFSEKKDSDFEKKVLKHFEDNQNKLFSVRHYVKNFDKQIVSAGETDTKPGEMAIVLRGLPREENDFTINTIRIYKKIFPKAILIYSLWSNTSPAVIKKLEDEGCILQLTAPLKNGGVSNINNQIISQLNGVKMAQKLGVKYVFCHRADSRCLYSFALEYLKSLIEIFEISEKFSEKQKKRIVAMGCYTNRVQELPPFFMRDYAYFGETEDLLNLFDIPLTTLEFEDYNGYRIKSGKTFLSVEEEDALGFAPESYITTKYLEKLTEIDNLQKSYDLWWDLYKDVFISISPWDIDLYWDKYDVKYMQPTSYVEANNKIYETRNYDFRKFVLIKMGHMITPKYPFEPEDEFQRTWIGW